MKRFAIYCRISQDLTGESASPAIQEKECRRYAEERGYDVIHVYTDRDRSAYKQDVHRPEYEALLDAMATGEIDGVLVWKLDRLMRRIIEFSRFWAVAEKHDVALVSKHDPVDTTTPLGLAVVYLLVGVAETESRNTSIRWQARHLDLAENGQISGGGRRPFGYEADQVTICEAEADEISDAVTRILAGESLRGITHDWRERGIATVTGATWSPTTIRRLLCSGRISGQREHRGKIVGPAVWPAIISPQETARLRARLNNPARSNGEAPARSYLLSGFVICGACGNRLSARAAIRKGNRYRRYHCAKDRGGCDRVGISAARLEELVTGLTLARLDTPEVTAHMAADADEDETAQLVDEVQRLEADLEQLARDHYVDKAIGRIEFFAARSDLVAELTATREKVAKRRPVDVLAGLEGEGLRAAWPGLSLARQRAILSTVLESVTVGSTTRGNNRFDPSRVEPPNGEVRWRV